MTYPDNFETKTGFDKIRDLLNVNCLSQLGRDKVSEMCFSSDYEVVLDLVNQTAEFVRILQEEDDFPVSNYYDVRDCLRKIAVEGTYLTSAELFDLRRSVETIGLLVRFFNNKEEEQYYYLKKLAGDVFVFPELLALIDRILDKFGQVKDNASPQLLEIRREMLAVQSSISRSLQGILRQAQSDGFVDKDVNPTMRDGRLVIPVSPAFKRKIKGIVHDESATGKTVFIEPEVVVEANNKIRELESRERREIIRILTSVTNEIRPRVDELFFSYEFLAQIDFIRAKALFAVQTNSVLPVTENRVVVDWYHAVHPLLFLSHQRQGKSVVPLDITLDKGDRILLISGPNAGGKSVCLKTVGLLQYMFQCGMLVPMAEGSHIGFFEKIFIDIGDEQSIQDELSTYSSHLRNMKHFVRNADARTLFLIDEMGTGTEPLIGGAIAEAVLRELVDKEALGIVTTHYTNLKHFAEQTPKVVNGAMLYDRHEMRPLFQLSIGQAGSSFAVEIARQIGLSEPIIQYATDLVGEEHIDYDKHLQDIARDKRYWENKRQQIRQKEKALEERIAQYEEQMSGIKQKKRELLEEARQQAADLLQQSNATIERTIREIKEAKADKERTKAARKKVEAMKEKVKSEESKAESQESRAKGQESKVKSTKTKVEMNGKRVLKDFSELRAIGKQMAKEAPQTPSKTISNTTVRNTVRQRTLAFERTLDLRGMRIDEATERLIAYMDDALMVGAGEVTILHGTGTGALKQLTRDYLSDINRQRHKRGQVPLEYGDGDVNHGGAGLTIVNL